MKAVQKLNPTFLASFAVLIWGMALPVARYIESEIGVFAYIGTLFTATTIFGFLSHRLRGEPFLPKGIFAKRLLYVRWLAFLGNMPCIMIAVFIVQKTHVPFVILLNYLWPTATILFSVFFGGVRVRRPAPFIAGMLIVVAALSLEILQPTTLGSNLFSSSVDCLAYGLAVTAALCWGLYSALTRRSGQATGGSAAIPLFQSSLALALPLSLVPGVASWSHMTPSLGIVLGIWCVMQFGAFQAWDFGMRNGNLVALSLCADFIPWLSLAVSQLLLGVDIGHRTVLSAILLVSGAMTVRYGTASIAALKPAGIEEPLPPLPESID